MKNTYLKDQFFLSVKKKMKIDFANLKTQYLKYKDEIDFNINEVLGSSNFIMGRQVNDLERKLENYTGTKYAVTCSSGTDALTLSMMALNINPGDEIITSPFSFISTAETISLLKAKPVFVDIDPLTFNIDANKIESAITTKTKAIIPVSLFGQTADMNFIIQLANKYNLKIVVDGAQSFGSLYHGKMDSNLGDISTTSFFPAKPLGCYGDGGAIFTNNENYFNKLKLLRLHGQNKKYHYKYIGMGGRMDTIQAAVLLVKIKYFEDEIIERNKIADRYTKVLRNQFITPSIKSNRRSTWAQYTIRAKNRDNLQIKLNEKGIPTSIYYPIPLHLQECFKYLNYKEGDLPIAEKAAKEVISLPMNAFMENEIDFIIDKITSIKVN